MARRRPKLKFPSFSPAAQKWLLALLFLAGGVLIGIQVGERTAPKTKPSLPTAAQKKPQPRLSSTAPRKTPSERPRIDYPEPPVPSASAFKTPAAVPSAPRRASGAGPKVAIVLDDWGYNARALDLALGIREPLTLAVLPHLPYSDEVARRAHAAGHEIMLHMPMEPINPTPLEEGTILTSMKPAQIRGLLRSALEVVPYVKGVNNHMGSKVTQDPAVLSVVMSELKSRHLFFLNSMTTGSSVGRDVAGDIGITYAERDIFLDNERTEAAVLEQLNELKRLALRNGSAIGIGHDEPVTLRAIRKVLPQWKTEGIQVIKLSELIDLRNEEV